MIVSYCINLLEGTDADNLTSNLTGSDEVDSHTDLAKAAFSQNAVSD